MASAPSRDNKLSFHRSHFRIVIEVDSTADAHIDSVVKLSGARRQKFLRAHIQSTAARESLSNRNHLVRNRILTLINNFHFFVLLYFVLTVYTKFSKKSNTNFGKRSKT
nr:MAG TPA: hypothetical protein [Caudoviricetes sp.]